MDAGDGFVAGAGAASPPFWTGGFIAAIGVPSGRKETVRTGLGLGNSDVMAGGGAAAGGTSGVLMVAATGVASMPAAEAWAAVAAAGGLAARRAADFQATPARSNQQAAPQN